LIIKSENKSIIVSSICPNLTPGKQGYFLTTDVEMVMKDFVDVNFMSEVQSKTKAELETNFAKPVEKLQVADYNNPTCK
jgi:hypothetical protein